MSRPPPAPPSPLAIRVLTVNTHKGFTSFNRRFMLHELREAVRAVGADVVFLQEVQGAHERPSRRHADTPGDPHYEFLADQIWPDYAYGRNAVYTHGHHGNAVLSKFPIERSHNHDVSIRGPERRGLLHCVLRVPEADQRVDAICVHLGLAEAHREQQLHLLCKLIHRDVPPDSPLLVAGDFNDWRQRASPLLARGCGLREVHLESQGRAARTFPARWPMLPLDRIYVRHTRRHAPLVLPHRPWSHLSDHAPLAAEITL